MTIDELRAFCLSLPGTHEKETWGDAEHAGDVTFRVKDKIYVITGPEGGGASIRTTIDQQAELLDTFPGVFRSAAYVGRSATTHPNRPTYADGRNTPGNVSSSSACWSSVVRLLAPPPSGPVIT